MPEQLYFKRQWYRPMHWVKVFTLRGEDLKTFLFCAISMGIGIAYYVHEYRDCRFHCECPSPEGHCCYVNQTTCPGRDKCDCTPKNSTAITTLFTTTTVAVESYANGSLVPGHESITDVRRRIVTENTCAKGTHQVCPDTVWIMEIVNMVFGAAMACLVLFRWYTYRT